MNKKEIKFSKGDSNSNAYYYLRIIAKTHNENYLDNYNSVDKKGKEKLVFGYHFSWYLFAEDHLIK